jgi:hypothetical protein
MTHPKFSNALDFTIIIAFRIVFLSSPSLPGYQTFVLMGHGTLVVSLLRLVKFGFRVLLLRPFSTFGYLIWVFLWWFCSFRGTLTWSTLFLLCNKCSICFSEKCICSSVWINFKPKVIPSKNKNKLQFGLDWFLF